MVCINPDHFITYPDGSFAPAPWMQLRQVATATVAGKSGNYGVSGGVNKNELLHTVTVAYTNDSPVDQLVYGLVTRGGAQVTLQARSRGGLVTYHGVMLGVGDPPVAEVSRLGVGGDVGRGGILGFGTGFCVLQHSQSETTTWLMPKSAGWYLLDPGASLTARVDVRFVSEYWESSAIDGGDQGTESSYISGDTRVDLFAVPVIA